MGRSPCCDKDGLKKGPWTAEEDMKLIQYIQMHGPGNWRSLPKHAGLQRCGKSCRLRWTNYLRPDIKRGRFSFEEEESIIQLHSALGNKWSAIAARLPGRTDNEIKNYWNTHIRKRLLKMGIDPVTHAPRLDFLDLSSFLSSSQLNLSNLIRLQTLLNPDTLRLAFSLMSSNIENPNSLLQKLQESQFLNSQLQNHQASTFQPNQFENILNQQIPSNLITQSMQQNNGDNLNVNASELSNQILQDSVTNNVATTSENPAISLSNYLYGSDQMKADLSENSSFQSLNSSCSNINSTQNFGFDSVLSSTPLSSPANLNSGSTFVGGSTEDERESFCSSLLRFENPQGFDLDNFM